MKDSKELLFSIIKENQNYVLVNKAPGLLVQSDKNEDDSNLLNYLSNDKRPYLHVITRIDRPVSGLCLLVKNRKFNKHILFEQENDLVEKTYLAVVEGKLELDNQQVIHHGMHNKRNHKCIIVDENTAGSSPLVCNINTLHILENYSLLSIKIHGGKFHQIRAQLSALGHPIKGDVKYGARRKNKDRSIHLHAYKMSFANLNGDKVNYEAELPKNDDLWKIINDNFLSNHG